MQNFYKINILGLQFLGLFHRLHLPKKYSSQQDSEVFPIEMIVNLVFPSDCDL